MKKTRILMVCLGNICRSPSAEAMLRKRLQEAGLEHRVDVDSAGTADYHVGDLPDRRSIAHGERRGLEMRQLRGRQVARADFERFDLILAMDEANLDGLERLRPADCRARLELLMAYAPESGMTEVPDPYYGHAADFERVLDLVDAAAAGLIDKLDRETPQKRG